MANLHPLNWCFVTQTPILVFDASHAQTYAYIYFFCSLLFPSICYMDLDTGCGVLSSSPIFYFQQGFYFIGELPLPTRDFWDTTWPCWNTLGLYFPLFLDYTAFRGPLLLPLLLGTLYSMSFCALCRITVIILYVSNCYIPAYTFYVAHAHFNSPFSCKPARYSAESKYLLPGDFL